MQRLPSLTLLLSTGLTLVVPAACGSEEGKRKSTDGGAAGEVASPSQGGSQSGEAAVAGGSPGTGGDGQPGVVGGASGDSAGGAGGGGSGDAAAAGGGASGDSASAGSGGAGGDPEPPSVALPPLLTFDTLCGDADVSQTLTLQNTGGRPFAVASLWIEGPFSIDQLAPFSVAAGETVELTISASAAVVGTDVPGELKHGTLTLDTELGQLEVALQSTVRGARFEFRDASAQSIVVPWQQAVLGATQCAVQTVQVVNVGNAAAELTGPVSNVNIKLEQAAVSSDLEPSASLAATFKGPEGACDSAGSFDFTVIGPSCELDPDHVTLEIVFSPGDSTSTCFCST